MIYGLILCLLSAVTSVTYSIMTDKLSLLTIQVRAALPHLLVIAYLLLFTDQSAGNQIKSILAIKWLMLLDLFVCILLTIVWYVGTRATNSVVMYTLDNASQIFAILIIVFILNKPLGPYVIVGSIITIIGVTITTWK